ncbi:MAG: molybdopterin-containing oxidoreductase family protein, partial [Microthrixaceae bacterium]
MAEKRKTFCRVCHAACPLEVEVADGLRVLGVAADRNDPLFGGYTCIKGRQLADQHHHPDRLRGSLRKRGGRFDAVASSVALDEIAERIAGIASDHGPRAVASYTGTGA